MEVLIYVAVMLCFFPYALMVYASFKIQRELKQVLNTPTDDLDFPTTL